MLPECSWAVMVFFLFPKNPREIRRSRYFLPTALAPSSYLSVDELVFGSHCIRLGQCCSLGTYPDAEESVTQKQCNDTTLQALL